MVNRRLPTADAWTQLVLRTMRTAEIEQVLESGEAAGQPQERWLRDELAKRRLQEVANGK